jgi:ClpA/ClpB-like protein
MFAGFTPSARQAVVRSGRLAADAGRAALSTDFLLLGLTEVHDLDPPLERLGITAAAVRAHIDQQHDRAASADRELLASLGIDLDEVHRRAGLATSTSPDDPSLWRLCRSRVHPLRVALVGPASHLQLDGRSRKVIEVAMHYARRRHAPVTGEDLLVGLLADGSNQSVRILCRLRVDLGQLWSDLHLWYTAA